MKNEDISKLQSESLQLRNQQFQIVTLALASTGISAWLIPAVFSGEGKPNDLVIIAATGSWMFLLGLFFSWSLSLKRLIDVIGSYLKMNHLSEWEDNFFRFHKRSKIHLGQTKYSLYIFLSYGLIVTISGVIAVTQLEWKIALGVIGGIYFIYCIFKYRFNSKTIEIEKQWKQILAKDEIEEIKKEN